MRSLDYAVGEVYTWLVKGKSIFTTEVTECTEEEIKGKEQMSVMDFSVVQNHLYVLLLKSAAFSLELSAIS